MLRPFRTGASAYTDQRPLAHRLLPATLALCGALLSPGEAGACGASPTPSYTISGVTPSPGATGHARDGGIIVRGLSSSPSGGPSSFAEVELIDVDSGQPVPLRELGWYSPLVGEDTMVVHPVESLAPLHRYRIEADAYDSEVGGTDGGIFVSTFETSDVLLEPLTLAGDLEFSLRGAEVDTVECGICGGTCNPVGKRPALMTDVQLPVPSGGQGVYQVILHLTGDTPAHLSDRYPGAYEQDEPGLHDVQVMHWVEGASGAITVQQELPLWDVAYAPCFTYVVYDPAGHVAQASACLPILSQADIEALASDKSSVLLDADNDVATEQIQKEISDRRDRRANGPLITCALDSSRQPARGRPAGSTLLLSSFVLTAAIFRRLNDRTRQPR
jgi:hypothetical protein